MSAHPIRVAILDDDSSVRAALVRLLKSAGMAAHGYAASSELCEAVAQERPDCLLLDLHGSELNGLDVVAYLHQRELRIPTIIITGSDETSRQVCMDAGAAGYLHKPMDPDQLIGMIEQITGVSKAGASISASS